MKNIEINKKNYQLVKEVGECFEIEEVKTLVTEYFADFDYIFGDYAYEKLRLKGFNDKNNANFNSINDIKGLDNYIKNYCVYGAKYFLLKKVD